MTLQQIDEALLRIPASPETTEDIEARYELMWRRYEVLAAEREAAACREAAERWRTWGLPLVNVPTGVDCVITDRGRSVVADIVDGRRIMRLTKSEMLSLSIGNQAWLILNPEIATEL